MGVDMLFILLLALILFGPKRLPEIAREVGKFMAEFKRASNDFKYQLHAEIDKASTPVIAPSDAGGQQSSSSTPILLPPAILPATTSAAAPTSLSPPDESQRSQGQRSPDQEAEAAQSSLPFAPGGPDAGSRPASSAEAIAARPSPARSSPDPAHENGNSALQNS